MSDVILALRESRKAPHRYLTDYLNMRSRLGSDTLICIFEGPEDLPVYDVWIRQISAERYEPIYVNGKENVLDLNVLVTKLKEDYDHRVLFFCDTDFDHSKGRIVDERLYFTGAYSIENYLVSKQSFEEVLIRDFRMINHEQPDRSALISLFSNRQTEFNNAALHANAYIRWMRTEGIDCDLPNCVSQFISIELNSVKCKNDITIEQLASILKAKATPINSVLEDNIQTLREMNLSLSTRGKFIFDFFKRIINLLYIDRRSDTPIYFSRTERL